LGDYCREAKIIKINSPEYETIKGKINEKEWANKLIVTLGDRGCMYQKDNGFHYYPVDAVDVFDLSGAGDTFLAALISNYLESNNMDDAIKFANKKASEVIQERGVTLPKP
jgi:sugar/nucleoside kinase (ribokinase family)